MKPGNDLRHTVINKGAIFFGAWDRTCKPCGRSEPRKDKRITWRGNKW